jgi:transposase
MTLHPQTYTVPAETARIAETIFPNGNLYMQWYNSLGMLFEDEEFAHLYPQDGQSALSPTRLTLVLLLQFAEGLSDRQAAEAVRTRIDWKYLLCLSITDRGFHYSVLSEFRDRLLEGNIEHCLFEKLLCHFRDLGLLKKRGKQRTDSTHVLGAIRTLNRLEMVGETMRYALNTLATAAPEWTYDHTESAWVERYGKRVSDYHLPVSKVQRVALAEQIGMDGLHLLSAIGSSDAPQWLRQLPAIQTLHRVWLQNYTWNRDETLCWRTTDERPPASIAIRTPYDPEAHFSKKRSTKWVGYKVHLTETCDEDHPRLITHVETTPATVHDAKLIPTIHQALDEKICLPETHLVDSGYISAEHLADSRHQYDIDLLGPTRADTAWQTRHPTHFTTKDFEIDWEQQHATCPAGKTSLHWLPARNNKGKEVIQIKFSKHDCRACTLQPRCTQSKPPRRSITVQPKARQQALNRARAREQTEAFKLAYARRAGIEGTISQGVRCLGLRQSRYIGQAKTHLQHVLITMATNIIRAVQWLNGERPAPTRLSPFERLHAVSSAS